MNRQNQILSIVLAVQIVLAIVVFIPKTSSSDREIGPLLPGFDPADAVGLTIKDSSGSEVVFAKNDDGSWVMPNADDYPVDDASVEELLAKLPDLDTSRLIANSKSSYNRLMVGEDQFERLIEVELSGGDTERLYVGSSAGTNATHMRVDGDSEVYLTSGLATWEVSTTLSSWIDTVYFSVTEDDVIAVRLENANGAFEFEKIDGVWSFAGLEEGETFDSTGVMALLSRVTSVYTTGPIGKQAEDSFGMDSPQAVVTLTVQEEVTTSGEDASEPTPTAEAEDGEGVSEEVEAEESAPAEPEYVEKTYTLQVGTMLDDAYVVISSESEYYVRVSSYTGDNLVNTVREDFLVVPEETEDAASEAEGTDG
jgi:hypothetical protein